MLLNKLIEIGRGEKPADLLLKNAKLVNVFSSEIEETNIAIAQNRIVGFGERTAFRVLDLQGRFVCPGFIDTHIHIESAMVLPFEFARAVLPHGTTTAVIEPHDIANVLGVDGIRYLIEAAKYSPMSLYVMVPSCVPVSNLETNGGELRWSDLIAFKGDPWVIGLGEMMNYPGVLIRDQGVLDNLRAFFDRRIDGHAPRVTGRNLAAYVAVGIASDHECATVEEAREKIQLGMRVMIRESSNAQNLKTLLPVITPMNARRILFATDDRSPADLIDQGHIDYIVRTAIREGLDPVAAIQIATLNAAEYFNLHDRGAIAPGRRADLVVFDNFRDFNIEQVYRGGRLVARNGRSLPFEFPPSHANLQNTMNIDWNKIDLHLPANGHRKVRVIELIVDQIATTQRVDDALIKNGYIHADTSRDILKLAVIERHQATGNVGIGFVRGFNLKQGALGSSVAHDSHNLVIVGTNDEDMLLAGHTCADMQGGLAAVANGEVLARVPLPIAGLMSDQPIERLYEELKHLAKATKALGTDLRAPFIALSFLTLPVIPELRLTDKGLVDVSKFNFVSVLDD